MRICKLLLLLAGFFPATGLAQVVIPPPQTPSNELGPFVDAQLASDVLTLSQSGLGVSAAYSIRFESGSADTVARIAPPAGKTVAVGTQITCQAAELGTLTYQDGNFLALAGGTDFVSDSPLDLISFLWDGSRWREQYRTERDVEASDQTVVYRDFATGDYLAMVPMAPRASDAGDYIRYASFELKNPLANGYTIGAIKESIPATWLPHDDMGVTKTGTWTTSTLSNTYPSTTAYSLTVGDEIEFTATGTTFAIDVPKQQNGGFGIVQVDGANTLVNTLPKVQASDYLAVSAAVDNGSGLLRVTTSSPHGLVTNARVYANSLGGVTLPGAGPWSVTVVSSSIVDLQGTSGWSGSFTSGGDLSYFRTADLGEGYLHAGPSGIVWGSNWEVVSEGIANASHTITIEVLGSARGGVGSGTDGRLYVNGLGFTPDGLQFIAGQSTGRRVVTTRAIHDYRTSGISNIVYAPEYKADSGGSGVFEFMTGTHGNETQASYIVSLDGVTLSSANDEFAVGFEMKANTVGELTSSGNPMANFTQEFRFRVGGEYQARAIGNVDWLVAGEMDNDYRGMLPLAVRNPNAASPAILFPDMDRLLLGSTLYTSPPDYGQHDNRQIGNFPASKAEAYSTTHPVRVTVQRLDGSNAGDLFFLDRTDALGKVYLDQKQPGLFRTITVGTNDTFDVGWHMRRE